MLPGVFLAGQPPMIEVMTFQVLDLVTGLSYVIEIWHEPPP